MLVWLTNKQIIDEIELERRVNQMSRQIVLKENTIQL